ncbi:GntR family transcriptional regulator [Nakamurella leprariae]|uniref:GntR family transcriptional regulator n=1 Tax=Nakamurella leprariae TaxID=2803911 RepID=A0A938YJT3_9ACTN|nr:GntR family transcriptional regulator [Nakamurella leprariae]MBM9469454.1 GntR family transcriptional regulator [Nakamurella leprariae]
MPHRFPDPDGELARRAEHDRNRRLHATGRHTSARRAYEQLRAGLRTGELSGEGTLSELELMRELGASRNSVRRALQMLADEGLLIRRTKVGTRQSAPIYSAPIPDVPAASLLPPDAAPGPDADAGLRIRTLVADRADTTDPDFPADLQGWTGAVHRLEQFGRDARSPLFVRVAHLALPADRPGPPDEALHPVPHLDAATAFCAVHGVPLGEQRSLLSVGLASGAAAELLGVPAGTVVLARQLRLRDAAGTVREVTSTLFRADRVSLSSWAH